MKFKILGQFPREGRRWKIGEETARELEQNGRLEIVDGIVKKAVYPEDEADKINYIPFWSHLKAEDVGTAQSGKKFLNSIMDEAIGFDTVKPPKLIEELIKHLPKNSIILDSFAGSYIIYAYTCMLGGEFMSKNNIEFKKIPRDIKKFWSED